MDLVIRGLIICEFAYSLMKNWSERPNFQSKCVFLSANSVFSVQNSRTYLPRITRETSSCRHMPVRIQVNLVIRGLFICEFAYSLMKNWSERPNFQSKCVFLSANSVFAVRNSRTYLPRITRPTCTYVKAKHYVLLWCIIKRNKRCLITFIYTFLFFNKLSN